MTVTIDAPQPQGELGWTTVIRRGSDVAISVEAYPPDEPDESDAHPGLWDVRLTVRSGRVSEGLFLSGAICVIGRNAFDEAAKSLQVLSGPEWREASELLDRAGVFVARART